MNVVFFGTAEFAVPILERLATSRWRPLLVVTTPDAPAGRSQEFGSPPVKVAAQKLGIPVIQPAELRAQHGASEISGADLFIVAAYGKILPRDLLAVPKQGSLNVHPSLLPRWRGASPIQYSILHGDGETGVTIILMDEQVDHGGTLRYKKLNIKNQKFSAPELTMRLSEAGAELLLQTIADWLDGKIGPVPQDETKANYAPRLKKEDGHIDWTKSAKDIERMVRAFQPWPGAYTFWQQDGKQLRLAMEGARCEVQGARERNILPGTVKIFDDQLSVMTGQDLLIIEKLKPEGGNSMGGQEFLRGHYGIVGAILE